MSSLVLCCTLPAALAKRDALASQEDAERLPKPLPAHTAPCPPGTSPLRRFVCLQDDALLILGPRRHPALAAATSNTATAFSICTSIGFSRLEVAQYAELAQQLRPDIVLLAPDIELSKGAPGTKRRDKMDERTHAWVRGKLGMFAAHAAPPSLWAPLLPLEAPLQRSYLEYLEATPAAALGGLALHADASLAAVPKHLRRLPRLMLTAPRTPHHVLAAIARGADLLALPFVTAASETGVAFEFAFPAPATAGPGLRRPLAVDLHPTEYATDLSPLAPGCVCYACVTAHRAYVRHLLAAREMLAWTLLQLHNHHVVARFFDGVRTCIADGTFEREVARFADVYNPDFPEFKGEGPRLRGYQHRVAIPKPGGLNKAPWERIEAGPRDDAARDSTENKVLDEKRAKADESMQAGLFEGIDERDLEVLHVAQLHEKT